MPFSSNAATSVQERTPRSRDFYSAGYAKTLRKFREEQWYDVHPYSLAVWPHHYSDKIRRGSWWIRRCNYACIALELQLEGETIYETGGRQERLRPGELYVTLPGSDVRLENGPEQQGRQVQVIISGGIVKVLVESLGMTGCRRLRFKAPGEAAALRERFDRIADLLAGKRREDAAENSRQGYAFLLALAEKYNAEAEAKLPPLLTRAVWTMESNRGSHQSIGGLAEELGTSRATLTRLFRDGLGVSPQAYWNKLRMESAVQLVRGSHLSFKEIAERLGFRNSLYFSTVFRRYTGCTPTTFRTGEGKPEGGF